MNVLDRHIGEIEASASAGNAETLEALFDNEDTVAVVRARTQFVCVCVLSQSNRHVIPVYF